MRPLFALAWAASLILGGSESVNASEPTRSIPDANQPVTLLVNRITTTGELLPGVKFQVLQVTHISGRPVDISTIAGWELAAQFAERVNSGLGQHNAEFRFAPHTFRRATGHDGNALFDGLNPGLHLVSETYTPNGHAPTNPFWITLPLTHPDGTHWNYQVFAQPKPVGSFTTYPAASPGKTPPLMGSTTGSSVSSRMRLTFTGTDFLPLGFAVAALVSGFWIATRFWKTNVTSQ